jgi:DNA repair exonuclease SbcCD nuclease subunit
MNIGLITDTHFSFKKANQLFHDYFAKFYNDIFFPKLKELNIKTVVHLGDAFDNRKGVDYWALEWAKKNVYDCFQKLDIVVYNIAGNHDAYHKNTNQTNAIDLLLKEYDNVIPISSPKEFCIDGLDTLMLPWICTDNREKTDYLLKNTQAKVVFGHLELSGFAAYPGHIQTEGMDASIFKRFDRVYSGHYHTKSDDGKIYYLGNPYQMFWNDVDDDRGFHIFDTNTYELEYFKNPYNMFEKIYYEDTDYKKFKTSHLKEKIVKVVVRQKTDQLKFDKFIDKILKVNPFDLKVVEIIDINDGEVDCEEMTTEDTMSILDKYVEEAEFELDKMIVKKLLRDVYREALELE